MEFEPQGLRAEDEHEAEQHEEHLGREVDHREPDRELRRLRHPDDVEGDEDDDHDRATDDVPRVRVERLPEDREVVRHEEGGDRDRDDVDEELGPCIRSGFLDEIHIDLVPVLLGGGVSLFDHLGTEPIDLERTRVIEGAGVTHLTFRVVK